LPFLQYSRRNFGTGSKKRKTYRRFLGMIYFGGVRAALVFEGQRVATKILSKSRKSAKKSVKYFLPKAHFSAKGKLI
jgi:hypothetical protein